VPYLLFVGLGAIALAGLWAAPETARPTPPTAVADRLAGPQRKPRLPVPAAAGTLAAFSANGLFAGLSGLSLVTTLHHPAHALAGAALFLVFAAGHRRRDRTRPRRERARHRARLRDPRRLGVLASGGAMLRRRPGDPGTVNP
jgi:hypothetical protein